MAVATCALAPAYVIRWHIGPLPSTILEAAILATIAVFAVEAYRAKHPLEWRSPFTIPAAVFLVAGAISRMDAEPAHPWGGRARFDGRPVEGQLRPPVRRDRRLSCRRAGKELVGAYGRSPAPVSDSGGPELARSRRGNQIRLVVPEFR